MENNVNTKGKMSFRKEANFKNRITVFHDKIRRHLSAEYLYLTERKDALENDVIEMRFELQQKDKKLFKMSGQKDTRKYFSPLNLNDIDESHKDERMKQLASDISHLEKEIEQCDTKLREIKELLQEIDSIQDSLTEE